MRCGSPLLLALIVAGCGREARSPDWFEAHADLAAQVVHRCETLSRPDQACRNAERGLADARRDARLAVYCRAF